MSEAGAATSEATSGTASAAGAIEMQMGHVSTTRLDAGDEASATLIMV